MAFPGKYDFTINFYSSCKNKKNTHSTYSLQRNKLYVKDVKPCRIGFSFTASVPQDSAIRVFAVYRAPELMLRRVVRCRKHVELNSDHHLFPEHLIRCDHPSACYLSEDKTGVLAISVPTSSLPRGKNGKCFLEFKYMCFSSCLIGHGAIDSVFNLVSGEELLGCCRVETRVCASPSRDFSKQESLATSPKRSLPEVAPPATQLLGLSTSAISYRKNTVSTMMNRWLEIGDIRVETDSSGSEVESEHPAMTTGSNTSGNRSLTSSPPPRITSSLSPVQSISNSPATISAYSPPSQSSYFSSSPDNDSPELAPSWFMHTYPNYPASLFDTNPGLATHSNSTLSSLHCHSYDQSPIESKARGAHKLSHSYSEVLDNFLCAPVPPYSPQALSSHFLNGNSSPVSYSVVSPNKKFVIDLDQQNPIVEDNGFSTHLEQLEEAVSDTGPVSSQMSTS